MQAQQQCSNLNEPLGTYEAIEKQSKELLKLCAMNLSGLTADTAEKTKAIIRNKFTELQAKSPKLISLLKTHANSIFLELINLANTNQHNFIVDTLKPAPFLAEEITAEQRKIILEILDKLLSPSRKPRKITAVSTTSQAIFMGLTLQLLEAIKHNQHHKIAGLIQQGADPFVIIGHSNSLLHYAAELGHVEAMAELINYGIDPNYPSKTSQSTPLHLAAQHNHPLTVAFLLRQPTIKKNAQKSTGVTALHVAAGLGNKPVVAELLGEPGGAVAINAIADNGDGALHFLAKNTDISIATMLLAYPGIIIDLPNKYGDTPLMLAVQHNNLALVKLLLTHQASLTVSNEDGWTALHYAAYFGSKKTLEFLLTQLEIDINSLTKNSETALHLAVSQGHVACVKILTTNKDKPLHINATFIFNGKPLTALHLAVLGNFKQITRLLLQHEEIDITAEIIQGQSAVEIAAAHQQKTGDSTIYLMLCAHRDHPTTKPVAEAVAALPSTAKREAKVLKRARKKLIKPLAGAEFSSFLTYCDELRTRHLTEQEQEETEKPQESKEPSHQVTTKEVQLQRWNKYLPSIPLATSAMQIGHFAGKTASATIQDAKMSKYVKQGYYLISGITDPIFIRIDDQVKRQLTTLEWSAIESHLKKGLGFVGDQGRNGIKELEGSNAWELCLHGKQAGSMRLLSKEQIQLEPFKISEPEEEPERFENIKCLVFDTLAKDHGHLSRISKLFS